MSVEQWGAFAFGAVLGWFVYFTNRYRRGEAQFSDLTTLLGIVGGGAVTALFGAGDGALFGAYGLGLASGFFLYFVILVLFVLSSDGQFTLAWFLDGRRKSLPPGYEIPADTRTTLAPMSVRFESSARPRVEATARAPAPSPLETLAAERDRATQALHAGIVALKAQRAATADSAERTRLRELEQQLTDSMQSVIVLNLRELQDDPRVAASLVMLKQITKDMEAEAAAMKNAADAFAKVAKLLQQAGKVIGLITGLFA